MNNERSFYMSDKQDIVNAAERDATERNVMQGAYLYGDLGGRKEMSMEEKMWIDFVVTNFFDKKISAAIPLPMVSIAEHPLIINTVRITNTDKKDVDFRVVFNGPWVAEFGFFVSADAYKAITGEYANMHDEALRPLRGQSGETIYYVRFRSRPARDAIMQKMADCYINFVQKVELTSAKEMVNQAQQKKQEWDILQQQSERS